jgi:hypothetical protein
LIGKRVEEQERGNEKAKRKTARGLAVKRPCSSGEDPMKAVALCVDALWFSLFDEQTKSFSSLQVTKSQISSRLFFSF